ncbi:hypothetical protein [Formosa sp. A9]
MKTLLKQLKQSRINGDAVELKLIKRSIQDFNSTTEALWYGTKRYAH